LGRRLRVRRVAGVQVVEPNERMTADGSVRTSSRRHVEVSEVKRAIFAGESGWRRLNERHGGLVKPSIVFFGESLPKRFAECVQSECARPGAEATRP
jgi:NAD-dependent SIR2 family protein deacetylase